MTKQKQILKNNIKNFFKDLLNAYLYSMTPQDNRTDDILFIAYTVILIIITLLITM